MPLGKFDGSLYFNAPPASLSPALLRAFLEARYCLGGEGAGLALRVGRRSAGLEGLYASWGVRALLVVTAWNPGGLRRDGSANRESQRRLEARLRSAPWTAVLEGLNLDPGGLWPPEPSFWVAGAGPEVGLGLGAAFGQSAVVLAGADAVPRLAFCRA